MRFLDFDFACVDCVCHVIVSGCLVRALLLIVLLLSVWLRGFVAFIRLVVLLFCVWLLFVLCL